MRSRRGINVSDEDRERRRLHAKTLRQQVWWTKEQSRAQEERVETLMIQHLSRAQILADLGRPDYALRCRPQRVQVLIGRVTARWAAEDEQRRPEFRAKVTRSAERSLAQLDQAIAQHLNARALALEARRKGDKKAVVADVPSHLYREKREYLDLLARFTGVVQEQAANTFNLNLVVNNATLMAIQNMTEEEKSEMLFEAQEEARLAAAWRAEHEGESTAAVVAGGRRH